MSVIQRIPSVKKLIPVVDDIRHGAPSYKLVVTKKRGALLTLHVELPSALAWQKSGRVMAKRVRQHFFCLDFFCFFFVS